MAEVVERLDSVERRLTSVAKGLTDLREEVGGLRGEVGGLREEVGGLRGEVGGLRGEVGGLREEVGGLRGKVDGLSGEVQKLRILEEKNESNIKVIAEVQVHHGRKLDEITKALEPLARIDAFIKTVAENHEKRISDLERHTGIRE